MKTISRLWGGVATHIKENTDLISTHNYLSDMVDLTVDSTRTNKDIIDAAKAAEFPSDIFDDNNIINLNLVVCFGNIYHVISKELTSEILETAIDGAEDPDSMYDAIMPKILGSIDIFTITESYENGNCENMKDVVVFNVTTESSVSLGINADSNTLKNYILQPGYYVYRGIDDIQDEEGNHIDWLE